MSRGRQVGNRGRFRMKCRGPCPGMCENPHHGGYAGNGDRYHITAHLSFAYRTFACCGSRQCERVTAPKMGNILTYWDMSLRSLPRQHMVVAVFPCRSWPSHQPPSPLQVGPDPWHREAPPPNEKRECAGSNLRRDAIFWARAAAHPLAFTSGSMVTGVPPARSEVPCFGAHLIKWRWENVTQASPQILTWDPSICLYILFHTPRPRPCFPFSFSPDTSPCVDVVRQWRRAPRIPFLG